MLVKLLLGIIVKMLLVAELWHNNGIITVSHLVVYIPYFMYGGDMCVLMML